MRSREPITRLLAVLCSCCAVQFASGQVNASNGMVNSAGGSFFNDRIRIDWSVGENLRIDTRVSDQKQLVVTQGLLQPDIGKQVVYVTDPNFAKGEVKILPNPVKSILQVQYTLNHAGKMNCMLYSEKGERLYQTSFIYYGYGYTQSINMTKLATGSYFLYVELEPSEGPVIRKGSFKILKID